MSSPRTSSAATASAAAQLRGWLQARDLAVFRSVADRHWPGADPLLPKLSRSANHGLLWFGAAAGIAALGSSARSRRAALRGVASLAVASAAINTVGKGAVRRERPIADLVPVVRQLKRQPITTSFPSGHAASAAAFATGVALESKGWGAVVAPVAVAVAASRVYTGVHYPSDVLAGAALGIGAAFALRGVVPTRGRAARSRPSAGRGPGAALREGPCRGGEPGVGHGHRDRVAGARCAADGGGDGGRARRPAAAMEEAAGRGRALGVCGGDGTVNLAAAVAATHGMPLAVFPGGTLNHFAYDVGIETVHDTAAALTAGDAIRVDLGRFRPGPAGEEGADGYFLNAFSLGVYPELVRTREHWSPRIGGWPHGRARGVPRAARPHDRWRPNSRVTGGRCGCSSSATDSSSGWAPPRAAATIWRTGCWTSGWCTAAGRPRCACWRRRSRDR